MKTQKNLIQTLIDLIDQLVELALSSLVEPVLDFHARAQHAVEGSLRQLVLDRMHVVPPVLWKEGNLAYLRIGLVLPTLVFLSWRQAILPATLVLLVHVAAFLEGLVSEQATDQAHEDNVHSSSKEGEGYSQQTEEEAFEVVTTGSPHCMPSWIRMHRARIQSVFGSTMVDRVFAIVCWISLLHHIPATGRFHLAQYLTMISLVVMESLHAYLCIYKFYTTHLIAPPSMDDATVFHANTLNPLALEKMKRTTEYVGLALFILPWTRYLGLLLAILTLPLEYELVRAQGKKRVVYYAETRKSFDYKTLKEWTQMKSVASKLIIGVSRPDAMDMVMNACASGMVDEVIVEAPTKVDLHFCEKQGLDFVIITPGQTNVVTDEVTSAGRVLILGDHGHLRRILPKATEHKE